MIPAVESCWYKNTKGCARGIKICKTIPQSRLISIGVKILSAIARYDRGISLFRNENNFASIYIPLHLTATHITPLTFLYIIFIKNMLTGFVLWEQMGTNSRAASRDNLASHVHTGRPWNPHFSPQFICSNRTAPPWAI